MIWAAVDQQTKEAFAKIHGWASQHDRIKSVHVFGSRARGEAGPYSDIDIAIRLTGNDEREMDGYWIFTKGKWVSQLSQILPYPIDLQLACDDDAIVWPAVQKDGIQIFSRTDAPL